jgi:HAD superfamily phosphoserine phosphatase-like hydrolase
MIKLVAFDIDDTLTRGISIWEMIYRILGTWESVGVKYLERFRRGEIDYNEFARADAYEFRGNPPDIVTEAASRLSYAPEMDETFAKLHERGIATALVSCSIKQFADWLGGRLGVRKIYANPLIVGPDGLLTGEIELALPVSEKRRTMLDLREALGLSKDEILAVGDSILDFTMFEEAGITCCVAHASEEVKSAVTRCLPGDSLLGVLDLLEN